ncbi:Uncharacterised protein [Serratia rubidaea]|uniref:Uncharacterized protein n=1 Tax=Serratia rubidaea TaxID=61652 RepID=A0A4U9HGB1_SERRU|nr:Uncharacterised protein [Serratia rubidaea]
MRQNLRHGLADRLRIGDVRRQPQMAVAKLLRGMGRRAAVQIQYRHPAPWAAKQAAVARPMPRSEAAPVITAILLFSNICDS